MSRHLHHIEEEEDPSLSIDSLIDVAFLLLIYFLVTTTLQESEADLEIQVPGPPKPTPEIAKIEPMAVKIMPNGDIVQDPGKGTERTLDLGGSSNDLPMLRDVFNNYSALAASRPEDVAMVIIDPSPDVPSQRFIDVVNQAVGADIKNISFTIFSDAE